MRTFLLFIGSVLYPVVMVIISPVLLFLYLLMAFVFISRFANFQWHKLVALVANFNLPLFHVAAKKTLGFRPKAMRLH